MSLDVYLTRKYHVSYDGGNALEPKEEEVFSANITHNLNKMAMEAGIYEACWRPDEIGATKAKDIVDVLDKGFKDLLSRPEHFKQFDSPNGWGTYDDFLPWVANYLEACKEYPEAEIGVWI